MNKITLLALLGVTSASQLKREPLLTWAPKAKKTDHPMDYFVPNFGADRDIVSAQKHIEDAEKRLNHQWNPVLEKPDGPPMNYFVPNFGVDKDIATAQANIENAEERLHHKWNPVLKKPDGPPMDYFVPNFGVDKDIVAAQKHISDAEKRLNHVWNPDLEKKKDAAPPSVPDFGMDRDIAASLNNLHNQEAIHGTWDLPKDEDLQLSAETEREPLLTWKPKAPKSHPIDYFVPDFGTDEEIATSQANEHAAEKEWEHTWTPVKDEDDKWVLPHEDAQFQLVQLDREPLLSWKPKPPKSHPVDYFVPDFGKDSDIKSTHKNIEDAEHHLDHHWVWKKTKPEEDVIYLDKPLDSDIQDSLAHLKEQEKTHGEWILPEDD